MLTTTDAVPWQLADHAENSDRLSELMRRVETPLSPPEFLALVSRTYMDLKGADGHVQEESFRRSTSHQVFVAAIRQALTLVPHPTSILVLGVGSGFAGCRSRYARSAVIEAFTAAGHPAVESDDLTPRSLLRPRPSLPRFDIVASHSLLHFVPYLGQCWRHISNSVAPGGCYVMGHEPNARFWQHPHLVELYRRRVAGNRRPRPAWRRALGWVSRAMHLSDHAELHAQVNRRLIAAGAIAHHLAPVEINRLVDVHRRSLHPSPFRIGLDGIDLQQMSEAEAFADMRLVWSLSYDHAGYSSSESDAGAELRELGESWPDDGATCTAVWQKQPDTRHGSSMTA
jgi:hypothetical protein